MNNIDSFIFHDSHISKIELGVEVAKLTFNLIDETCVVISLVGLSRMLCNSLKEGNIVLEVAIIDEASIISTFLNKLFDLSNDDKKSNPAYLREIKKKLCNQDLVLFHVAPSYGCELIALCERVVTRQETN